jgi:hypothetical protein
MIKRLWIVPVLALLLVPAMAQAQFRQGDWELTLSGSGSNGPDFDGTSFNVGGSLGYFLTDEFEVALRQSIGFTDIGVSGDLNGSTRVAVDYNFNLGQWVPYIGANIGYVYGDAVNDTFEAAPEAGVKYFVNNTTFIFLSVEYQFFFDTDDSDDLSDNFSDGQFLYGLGIGFKF